MFIFRGLTHRPILAQLLDYFVNDLRHIYLVRPFSKDAAGSRVYQSPLKCK